MVNKLVSILTLFGLLGILLLSNTAPSDPLFALASEQQTTWLVRLALVAIMLGLAFKNRVGNVGLRRFTFFLGSALMIFAATAIILPAAGAAVAEYFKLLDLLVLLEAGVVFATVSLNIQPQPSRSGGRAKTQLRLSSGQPARV